MNRFLLIFFLFTCFISFGQNETNKLLWTGIGVKSKISNKMRFDIEHQVRFQKDFFKYHYTFTELAVNFSPIKAIRFNGNYRYMIYERGIRNRYAMEVHFYMKPNQSKLYFHVRERFQSFVWNDDNSSVSNIRSLFTIGYKLNDFAKIYTTQEWFFRLDNYNEIRTYRGTVGVNWNLTNKTVLMTYYSFQKSLKGNGNSSHIIGLRAFYKLNLINKKNK